MGAKMIKSLKSIKKDYYTIPDLEKILDQKDNNLLVTLARLEKRGDIKRIFRGVYQLPDQPTNILAVATQIYQPSYVSFESALSIYGILSQVPYTVTLATTKKPKKIMIENTVCEYRRIKPGLFFGFALKDNVYQASPEKALLDQLYFVSKGKATLDLEALDLTIVNKTALRSMMKEYTQATRRLVRLLVSNH